MRWRQAYLNGGLAGPSAAISGQPRRRMLSSASEDQPSTSLRNTAGSLTATRRRKSSPVAPGSVKSRSLLTRISASPASSAPRLDRALADPRTLSSPGTPQARPPAGRLSDGKPAMSTFASSATRSLRCAIPLAVKRFAGASSRCHDLLFAGLSPAITGCRLSGQT